MNLRETIQNLVEKNNKITLQEVREYLDKNNIKYNENTVGSTTSYVRNLLNIPGERVYTRRAMEKGKEKLYNDTNLLEGAGRIHVILKRISLEDIKELLEVFEKYGKENIELMIDFLAKIKD